MKLSVEYIGGLGLIMKLIDAHIHLSDAEYVKYTDELVVDAKNSNVVALVSNSMDLKTSIGSLKLAEKYPATVYPALGVHPWNVKTLEEDELEKTLALISEQHQKKTVVASARNRSILQVRGYMGKTAYGFRQDVTFS